MLQKSKISFNAFQLKILSLILYTVGKCFIQSAYAHFNGTAFEEGPWTVLYFLGYIFTFMALPIICFLTVEAVTKTRNLRQFFTRLGVAAIVCELFTDLAAYGFDTFDFSNGFLQNDAFKTNTNFYFTMILGSVAVCVMDRVIKKKFSPGSVSFMLFNVVVILGCCALSVLLNSEQGAIGVLTMMAVYLFYGNPMFTVIGVVILQVLALGRANAIFLFAPIIGCLPIITYNKEEGKKTGLIRLMTYAVYPICYSIVLLVLRFMGDRT